MNKVMAATSDGGHNWDLIHDYIQVYVVFSMSGATGGGIFLNLGYMLREMFDDRCCLYAYAVLPGVFSDCGHYVGANAYGAALDMDFLMSNVDSEHPYETSTMDGIKRYITKPYDLFYCIDNVNVFGERYSREQLYSVLGRTLVTRISNLGMHISVDTSIYRCFIAEGGFDIEDKTSWVMGQGYCEIMIDKKKLSEQFGIKEGMRLVSSVIGPDKADEMTDLALDWVNANSLCEHEADQLLDSLYDFVKLPQSIIASSKSAEAKIESDNWIQQGEQEASELIYANYGERLPRTKKAFTSKLSEVISSGVGLKGAKSFVSSVLAVFDIYAGEMSSELKTLNAEQDVLSSNKALTLEEWRKAFFGKDKYKAQLQLDQESILKNKIDISRHIKASQFYAELKEYINTSLLTIEKVISLFEGVNNKFIQEKTALSLKEKTALSLKESPNPFQIDLSKYVTIEGEHPDNTVEKFIASIPNGDILALAQSSTEEVKAKVFAFTSLLSGADFEYASVEEIILSMDSQRQRELFENAMKKASILLEVEKKGAPIIEKTFAYVCVPSGNAGKLAQVESITLTLNSYLTNTDVNFVPATTDSSIMIYVHSGVYPLFQIQRIVEQERVYNERVEFKSFSFDDTVEQKINDEDFGFLPNQRRDDDVLEMWVKGLIFGFIKKEGHRYFVQSRGTFHDYVDNDHWTELECGPEIMLPYENRYYAFKDFKAKKRVLRSTGDLLDKIRSVEAAKGRDELRSLYSEIQNWPADEYVTRYSLVGLEARTINADPSYYKIKSVMIDELWYVRERLLDSVK